MTSYEKEMVAKGYIKTRVSEIQVGDVVLVILPVATPGIGVTWDSADRTVSKVEQKSKCGKRFYYTDGTTNTSGNAGKVWKKN